MNNLPFDIIKSILTYDNRFVIRKGKIILIKKIEKNDERYNLLLKMPEKEYCGGCIYIYMKINQNTDLYMSYCDYEIYLHKVTYGKSCLDNLYSNSITYLIT